MPFLAQFCKQRYRMKKCTASLLFFIIMTSALFGANVMTLAVLDLRSEEVPSIVVNAVSDIVRTEFVNIANFRVVERDQMDSVFEEQNFQLSGLTDESSAVKIGEILSAQKVVIGEINMIEKSYVISLRIVDVETAESQYSSRSRAESMDELEDRAVETARDLAQRIVSGNKEYFSAVSPRGYYLRSILPGWGQFYADRDVEGFLFSGLSAAVLGFTGYTVVNYLQKEDAYNQLSAGTEQTKFDEAFADTEDAAQLLNTSLIALGSIYLIHWIDVLVFARPDFKGKDIQTGVQPAGKPKPQPLSLSGWYMGPRAGGFIGGCSGGLSRGFSGWVIEFSFSR